MKTRQSPPLLPFLLAFAVAGVTTAGLTLWAADTKAGSKKAPAASPADTPKAGEKRAPLRLNVDNKPINRDAPDRVSYAPVVKRTAASVVHVYSSKRVRAEDIYPFLNDPLFRRFFGIPGNEGEEEAAPNRNAPNRNKRGNEAPNRTPPRKGRVPDQTQQGLGSGVVVTADGYILTNNHVIEGADDVKVAIGESNKRYDAKVIGRDPLTDIAVLKIDATNLTPAVFGDSDQLQVGDVVLAIGNPFGVGQSVSRGIVSALSRGLGIGPIVEDFIQTDAAINPGNSGGALLDTEGRVIGINTAILSRTGGFAGVGFAIPINLARNVAEQIVNTGRVERGYLGVGPQDLSEELATQFGAEQGALISHVEPDTPAERAGLKPGDIITKVNNTEIRDARQLLLTVSQLAPGTEVAIEYLRDGKRQTARTKLARRTEDLVASADAGSGGKDVGVLNGVGVSDITPELRDQLQIPGHVKGAIITSVEPNSPSALAGLREGDIILDLNKRPVQNAEEAVKLSEEIQGPKVLVRVWRNGRSTFIAVDESKP